MFNQAVLQMKEEELLGFQLPQTVTGLNDTEAKQEHIFRRMQILEP